MKVKKGFTIIELMLAMAFLGTMMMGIAALIIQITNIYQKGLAIRNVNTVGREIISDLTRTVGASRVGGVTINPESQNVDMDAVMAARSRYFAEQKTSDLKQLSGAFCTGSYSYVWNTADALRIARKTFGSHLSRGRLETDVDINSVLVDGVIVIKPAGDNAKYLVPKFVRFSDRNRDVCQAEMKSGKNYYSMKNTYINLEGTSITEANITELIAQNEADLALYDFSIFPATKNYSTSQIFYSGTFILATYRGGVNIKSNGDFCQGSDNADEGLDSESEYTGNDFDYCAVNKFNFAVRATGEVNIQEHGGS